MLNCPYFEMYYSNVMHVFELLGYSNMKIDLYTLICGYKPGMILYKSVNLLLNITTLLYINVLVKIKINRLYVKPLETLDSITLTL